jgi:DNA-binding response OmpR family regulator
MTGAKTILLVDDDCEVVSGLKIALEAKGYRVLAAHDGNTGLALAETSQADLVIVDMMMPQKSGFLVLETLKRRGPASPKVIMITANEGLRHQAYAETLGVDDFLRKPFSLDELLASVGRLCPEPAEKP